MLAILFYKVKYCEINVERVYYDNVPSAENQHFEFKLLPVFREASNPMPIQNRLRSRRTHITIYIFVYLTHKRGNPRRTRSLTSYYYYYTSFTTQITPS